MGVRTMSSGSQAVMYCSTSDWAFGPVFQDTDTHDAEERMEMFLEWLPDDAREYSDNSLSEKYHEWLSLEDSLWAAKEQVTEETD